MMELKACPFCRGTEMHLVRYEQNGSLCCSGCGAQGPITVIGDANQADATGLATATWNTRLSLEGGGEKASCTNSTDAPACGAATSTPCQSEDAETSASIEYLRNVVAQTRPVGMTLSNDVRRLLAAYDRLQRERLQLDGLLPSANPSRDAIWDDGYEAGSRDHAGRRDEALALVRRELWWVGTCQPDRSAWTAVLTLDWPEFEALRRVAGLKPYRARSSEAPSLSPSEASAGTLPPYDQQSQATERLRAAFWNLICLARPWMRDEVQQCALAEAEKAYAALSVTEPSAEQRPSPNPSEPRT